MARGYRGLVAAGALAAFLGAFSAHAQTSEADKTTARVLFDDGRKLVEQKNYEDGCKKLAESNRLDPGAGVQFHLANCYEKQGKTASAWQLFLQVASLSRADKQPAREKVARDRAAELEPKLMRITIQVPEGSRIPGLVVKRDESVAAEAVWGSAVPVDPGKHTVQASAPGKKSWDQQVDLANPGQTVSVTVPVLEDDKTAGAAPSDTADAGATKPQDPAPEAASPPRSRRRTAGLVVGIIGAVGVGAGATIALSAKQTYDDAANDCNSDNVCNADGYDDRKNAFRQANLATVVTGLGAAALITGVVLFVTAPKSAPAPSTALVAGPGTLMLRGTW
jgi:hypothetical protein